MLPVFAALRRSVFAALQHLQGVLLRDTAALRTVPHLAHLM
jgi:hypothetical protein